MRLSDDLIAKFQQAHLEEYGQPISAEAAEVELLELAELVEITGHTHRPADKDEKDNENET